VREQAEARLGVLGPVRLHTGSQAKALGKQMGADAFTLGRDIGIAKGNWSASTPAGARLLLHELVHVSLLRRLRASPSVAVLPARFR
jgi:hypothetical protein